MHETIMKMEHLLNSSREEQQAGLKKLAKVRLVPTLSAVAHGTL
jgi:hypothetical protein